MPSLREFKRPAAWGLVYCAVLLSVAAFAALAFHALYAADSLAAEPELSLQYRHYLAAQHMVLAVVLGSWSGALVAWTGRVGHGLLVLLFGIAATAVVLSFLPWVRFPADKYAPTFGWVVTGIVPSAIGFALVALTGRLVISAGYASSHSFSASSSAK